MKFPKKKIEMQLTNFLFIILLLLSLQVFQLSTCLMLSKQGNHSGRQGFLFTRRILGEYVKPYNTNVYSKQNGMMILIFFYL